MEIPEYGDVLQPGDPEWVGSYQLVRRLGSGGMGRVFLGQSRGERLVAVKVIRAELAESPEFRLRFAREVAAARRVASIYTVQVVDADPDAPQPWLVTAFVRGPSLADLVARGGPLPVASVLTLAAGLAEGLAAIHVVGVVHRDLKPSNVLLADDGPRIIDFGISRAADATALTGTGSWVGSPGFMSPEQAEGRECGPSSDIFSLGAVLMFAAKGEGPFGIGATPALVYRVVHSSPSTSSLPAEIRTLVEHCLVKDPQLRPTPDQILTELRGTSGLASPDSGVTPGVNHAPTEIASPAGVGMAEGFPVSAALTGPETQDATPGQPAPPARTAARRTGVAGDLSTRPSAKHPPRPRIARYAVLAAAVAVIVGLIYAAGHFGGHSQATSTAASARAQTKRAVAKGTPAMPAPAHSADNQPTAAAVQASAWSAGQQMCADVQRDDGGVVGGDDVGCGERPRRGCSGGALVCVLAVWWSV